jgi:hypothetical protein
MAEAYGLKSTTYRKRISYGWSIEKSLLTPNKSKKGVIDHLGNYHINEVSMTKVYGISYSLYKNRRRLGWNIKSALTKPVQDFGDCNAIRCEDHLGNKYRSFSEMVRFYNLTFNIVRDRLESGWTLKDSLEIPKGTVTPNSIKIKDHLGEEYLSKKLMAEAWGLEYDLIKSRLSYGWDIEAVLTTPISSTGSTYIDYLGNKHSNLNECCKFYGITLDVHRYRKKRGWTAREIFQTPNAQGRGEGRNHNLVVNDKSLNELIVVHEYSHTVELTGDRVFRCTIIETGETKYMNEDQVRNYPESWK